MLKRLILFTIINFGALALGGIFTPSGISSDWYQELNKAPWTPPGWVFGFAWTTIMICLSIFMAFMLKTWDKTLVRLYSLQLILNVLWTPTFFYFHQPALGLIIIVSLTVLIGLLMAKYSNKNFFYLLLAPYFIWLCIATSLNTFVTLYN
ncbi:tryptophan-rich sensory protein [Cyclobacteriaceae bacterium]|nr:tryptophan-rich sensory protein [Cyclobacteriaceae bacterium]